MKKISTGDSMCGRYSIYESMDHYLILPLLSFSGGCLPKLPKV